MTIFSTLFSGSTPQPKTAENTQQTIPQNTNNSEQQGLARQKTNESMEEEHFDLFANVRDTPIAAWHIHGRNKYYNDEEYRKLVEEAKSVMFSSIM
ncbi:unnamed protein product [Kluyveromyces dobzhanskii CBS 2104]|uniref:WGS project CCBQ000000000 data, contig 00046 n=1 Tax=Kluyveromyces dobzhanskii CBS 2104 TaxID=1427455 RepID=A0A0A8L6X9_9SACH|nr:unnamed protein product [Kluyveromyces dobzhanskii CBS 2104]